MTLPMIAPVLFVEEPPRVLPLVCFVSALVFEGVNGSDVLPGDAFADLNDDETGAVVVCFVRVVVIEDECVVVVGLTTEVGEAR